MRKKGHTVQVYLRTLGGLKLEGSDLARHKPLLLLAYLALEGRQPRRDVAELFWLGYKNPLSNLSVALSHLRKADETLIEADDIYVEAKVKCDALELLASEADAEVLRVYRGAFLEGVFLSDWNAELEEWLYEQRESLAAFAQARLLSLAETLAAQGQLAEAARRAEEAYRLRGAPPLAPEVLPRFYTLFAATRHPYLQKIRAEAEEVGLDLVATKKATAQFAPPQAAPAPTTLPRPTTSLIGRERELRELSALLADARIVTVTGLSGCGKTRLALELAHQLKPTHFEDGIYFVPLQGVTDLQEARRRGAQVLGIPPVEVELSPKRIQRFVGDKSVLFVLDGVDTTIHAAPVLSELLWESPNVKFLVTSEERLKLPGEQLYPLQGLPCSAEPDLVASAEYDAIHDAAVLFAARAAQVKPGFTLNATTLSDILRICELIEGLPLAIELAAPWVKLLPLKTIADEIATNLDFLKQSSRSPLREAQNEMQSMSAAFEQSWGRLDAVEQRTLRALSLFRGSFGLDAARAVAGASPSDLLNLHDKSLLKVMSGGRFELAKLLRRFVREKLDDRAGQGDLEQAFITHYAGVLASAEEKITDQAHMSAVINELEQDLFNLEQAWRWALEQETTEFFRAANVATAAFFDFTGRWQIGIELFKEAVTWAETKDDVELWGELVRGRWRLLYSSGSEASLEYAQQALEQAKERGLTSLEAYLTLGIARIHTVLGDIGSARGVLERCRTLGESADDADFPIMINVSLAELELLHGDEPAPKLFDPATLETLEGDSFMLSVLFYDSRYALRHGDLERAEAHMEACMALAEKLNYLSFSPYYHDTLALILHARGDYAAAETTAREGYRFAEKEAATGMMLGLETTLARILPHTGQPDEAQTLLEKGVRSAWSRRMMPVVLKGVVGFAEQCIVTERFAEAAQALRLVLNHPATMRIEHPLIEKRLDELGDIMVDLEGVTLEDMVRRMLEG